MGTTILHCSCGMKVQAPGAIPGRVGRCPRCGGRLEVPPAPDGPVPVLRRASSRRADGAGFPAADGSTHPTELSEHPGYALQPEFPAPDRRKKKPGRDRSIGPDETKAGPRAATTVIDRTPIADGLLKPLQAPERSLSASLLYPLRSADSLGIVVAIGAAFWILIAVVSEYCRVIMSDAEGLSATSMGWLVSLVTSLPVVFLLPLTLLYLCQYLRRVIIASGQGETVPPKTPDRNFDGFFDGLGPWFIWLILGAVPGFLPLWLQVAGDHGGGILRIGLLASAGVAYSSVALMRTFLDDNPLAGNPAGVLGAVLGHGGAVLPAMFRVLVLAAGILGLFGLLVALRAAAFWVYMPAALPFCWAVVWALIVAMRVLGLGYYHHRDELKWQAPSAPRRRRERPRTPEGEVPLAGADI